MRITAVIPDPSRSTPNTTWFRWKAARTRTSCRHNMSCASLSASTTTALPNTQSSHRTLGAHTFRCGRDVDEGTRRNVERVNIGAPTHDSLIRFYSAREVPADCDRSQSVDGRHEVRRAPTCRLPASAQPTRVLIPGSDGHHSVRCRWKCAHRRRTPAGRTTRRGCAGRVPSHHQAIKHAWRWRCVGGLVRREPARDGSIHLEGTRGIRRRSDVRDRVLRRCGTKASAPTRDLASRAESARVLEPTRELRDRAIRSAIHPSIDS